MRWREDNKITEGLGYQREKVNYVQREAIRLIEDFLEVVEGSHNIVE